MMLRISAAVLVVSLLSACAPPVVIGAAAAGGAVVATDQRSAGTMVDDEGIEIKASSRIHADAGLKENCHINITSFNGVVLLTGEAVSEGLRERAAAIVKEIPQVRHVQNELLVAEPSNFTSRSTDTWITTKVKSKLFGDKVVKGSQVKVVTENATVFLMGLVSREQGHTAAEIARDTRSVARVVKVFEYVD